MILEKKRYLWVVFMIISFKYIDEIVVFNIVYFNFNIDMFWYLNENYFVLFKMIFKCVNNFF